MVYHGLMICHGGNPRPRPEAAGAEPPRGGAPPGELFRRRRRRGRRPESPAGPELFCRRAEAARGGREVNDVPYFWCELW